MCELHKFAGAFDIDRTIGPQQPQNDSNCTELLHVLDVFPYHGDLGLGVLEAAAARAEKHVDRKTAALDGCPNQAVTRSEPTFAQRGT